MSFKDTSPDNRLGSFHFNEILNINARFEILENVTPDELVKWKEEVEAIRDILLSIKINNSPLFLGVEQGSRKNENYLLLISTPKIRFEARR